MLDEWPSKLDEIRSVTDLPVWVSEVGVSTFGAEEVQELGLRRTAEPTFLETMKPKRASAPDSRERR